MRKPTFLFSLLISASLLALSANTAQAQRRILGESAPAEEAPAENESKAPPKDSDDKASAEEKRKQKAAEDEEKARREAEETAKKEAAAKAQAEAEEKAEQEAAAKRAAEEDAKRKAEEEARKKAEEEAQKKAEEAKRKEAERLEGLRNGRLQAAKTRRQYMRTNGNLRATIAVEPGAPKKEKLMEVRVQLGEKLKVADPRYGTFKPRKDFKLTVTVREPAKRKPVVYRYRMHPLPTPGSYGFHHTLRMDGEHTIQISGKSANGDEISLEIPLHAGVWPPPDFDEEDTNTRRLQADSGRRRTLGAN